MTITYSLTVSADIIFDGELHYEDMNSESHPIQDYIDQATWFMDEYGFKTAVIIDAETGETLVEMERDTNDCYPDDDGLPKYYDDGNTCGYE